MIITNITELFEVITEENISEVLEGLEAGLRVGIQLRKMNLPVAFEAFEYIDDDEDTININIQTDEKSN